MHRILQHVDDLVDTLRLIVASYFSDECSISAQADTLASRYRDLFIQFSSCRKIYMSSSLISEEQLDQLSAHTTTFLATVRREVTSRKLGNITPKLHLLEEHAPPQIRHFGCGLGLLGARRRSTTCGVQRADSPPLRNSLSREATTYNNEATLHNYNTT